MKSYINYLVNVKGISIGLLIFFISFIIVVILIICFCVFIRSIHKENESNYTDYNSEYKDSYQGYYDNYSQNDSYDDIVNDDIKNNDCDLEKNFNDQNNEFVVPDIFENLPNLSDGEYQVYRNRVNNTIWILDTFESNNDFYQKLNKYGAPDTYYEIYENYYGGEFISVIEEWTTDDLAFLACKVDGTVIMYNYSTERSSYVLNPDKTVLIYQDYEKL